MRRQTCNISKKHLVIKLIFHFVLLKILSNDGITYTIFLYIKPLLKDFLYPLVHYYPLLFEERLFEYFYVNDI